MVFVAHDLVAVTLPMLRICRKQLNAELTGSTTKLGDDFGAACAEKLKKRLEDAQRKKPRLQPRSLMAWDLPSIYYYV